MRIHKGNDLCGVSVILTKGIPTPFFTSWMTAKGMHQEASPSLNSFAKGVLGISPPISGVRTVLDELEEVREEET